MSVGLWGAPPTPQSILMGEGLVSPPSNLPPEASLSVGVWWCTPSTPEHPYGSGGW